MRLIVTWGELTGLPRSLLALSDFNSTTFFNYTTIDTIKGNGLKEIGFFFFFLRICTTYKYIYQKVMEQTRSRALVDIGITPRLNAYAL